MMMISVLLKTPLKGLFFCKYSSLSIISSSNPYVSPTFNLSPMIQSNPNLKTLVDLGVNLGYWERSGRMKIAFNLTNLDLKLKELSELLAQAGENCLPDILTESPELLEIPGDIISSRLKYLESKHFTSRNVGQILLKTSGSWLLKTSETIDNRLGYFQQTFNLTGSDVRKLAIKDPSLIIWEGVPSQVRDNIFALSQLMGFRKKEMKMLLLTCPTLFQERHESHMVRQFDYLHNTIGYSHKTLIKFPEALLGHNRNTIDRWEYLKFLGLNQINPKLPNYVSPRALVIQEQKHFCRYTANTSEDLFDKFLKTL